MVFLNCVSITRPSKTEGFTIWYTIIVCKITQYALSHFIISNIAAQWVSSNNNGMEDKAMGSRSTEFVYKIPKKEKKRKKNPIKLVDKYTPTMLVSWTYLSKVKKIKILVSWALGLTSTDSLSMFINSPVWYIILSFLCTFLAASCPFLHDVLFI